jgi:subtilisin family serine protease
LPSTVLSNAINNAITSGRNGLGCIVVFATGNNNSSTVDYPANLNDNIIAVGAMSPCGERKSLTSCDGDTDWGSNYGYSLDLVAPGVFIPTTTTTMIGYTDEFSGTSAACPHVAAVAGLVLSKNPTLKHSQVKYVIESTARKVRPNLYTYSTTAGHPNGTWNNEMGYGLVDAYAAVQLASCIKFIENQTISSNTTVSGCEIHAKSDVVTGSSTQLTFNATGDAIIDYGGAFQVNYGASFVVNH